MDTNYIKKLLEQVADGSESAERALEKLRGLHFEDLAVAKPDGYRFLRNEFTEVIFCRGKQPDHLLRIIQETGGRGHNAFGTHADVQTLERIAKNFPKADCDVTSRTFRIINRQVEILPGNLAILCAGTADIPVAEEARRTAEFFGVEATRYYDVGVAGLHRILSRIEDIRDVDCAIVVAGMEGALPSVIGGLIKAPIIAVPTSIGYGASFQGIAALLAMLNSCSEGISVVNIDNGFGAACAALRILRCLRGEGGR